MLVEFRSRYIHTPQMFPRHLMQKLQSRLLLIITLITALVAYSTNSLSIVFANYDECVNSWGVYLYSQADVDQFSSQFGGSCNTINGDLYISGADISNLDGLIQVE